MGREASPPAAEVLAFGDPAARWVLAATVLGSGLAFLDATVVNIALPAIGRDLGADVTGLTWTVNAYTLTLAACVLVGGSLGDRFGRRRVFLIGVAWFGAASVACAMATGVPVLVVARALQGVGAALLTPGALAILRTTFREADRSRAIGVWSGLAGLTGAVGPFLGGWLLGVGSWRWIFLINVPIVLGVLAIGARFVPESRDARAPEHIDALGAALAVLGLGAVTYGLSVWPVEGGGSAVVLAALGLGVVTLVGFVAWERTTSVPMLPLRLFSAPRFAVANLVTFLVYAGLGGVFFWLVVALQVVAGWTPLAAGLSLLPITGLMLVFSPSAGVLGDKLGPRIPMTAGPLLGAVGVALLARVGPETSSWPEVVLPVTVLGVGLTLTVTPLTSTALGAVPDEHAGLASGVNNAVARTGGLVIVAALPTLTGLGAEGFGDAGVLAPAFRIAMLVCAALLAVGGIVAALFLRPPRRAPEEESVCPRYHCAIAQPPVAVAEDRSGRPSG
ncbi:MFS transporter [Saccharomonospora azurea]|uniref:MFS transporter n=1 Tax=Saccharomonospora azurea TaxID=40988 RepID=UPI003D905A8F